MDLKQQKLVASCKSEILNLFQEPNKLARPPTTEEVIRWEKAIIETHDEELTKLFGKTLVRLSNMYHRRSGFRRSYASCKYKLIKSLKNRTIKFRERAKTKEQKEAWSEVMSWLDSFINLNRIETNKGAIGIEPNADMDDFFRFREWNDKNGREDSLS